MIIDQHPYTRPENLYQGNFYTQNHRLRYGYMPSTGQALATALMIGGQASFVEEFYETLRNLSEMQIQTYYLEPFGMGGSDRQFPDDREKPPVVSVNSHVADLENFIDASVKPSADKPLISLTYCYGSFIATHYLAKHRGRFDKAVMVSPMFGMRHPRFASRKREKSLAQMEINSNNICHYIGNTQAWTIEEQYLRADRDRCSHHETRKYIAAEWRVREEMLRLGGYTYGNGIVYMRDLGNLIDSDTLESITTPVTIFSGSEDTVANPERHTEFASRMRNANVVNLVGAGHSILQERDEYRDPAFKAVEAAAYALV